MKEKEKVVRPGGFELPTFWFVGGFCALHRTTTADKAQRNQRKARPAFGSFRLALYPVHGQSHGQFLSSFLRSGIRPSFGTRLSISTERTWN